MIKNDKPDRDDMVKLWWCDEDGGWWWWLTSVSPTTILSKLNWLLLVVGWLRGDGKRGWFETDIDLMWWEDGRWDGWDDEMVVDGEISCW